MFYRIFDNNSSQQPRYTVVFDKHHPAAPNANVALVMATNISHICEHTSVPIRGELSQATAGELGVELHWSDLPVPHQRQLAAELDDCLTESEWEFLFHCRFLGALAYADPALSVEGLVARDLCPRTLDTLATLLTQVLRDDYRSGLAMHRYSPLWGTVADVAFHISEHRLLDTYDKYDPRDIQAIDRALRGVVPRVVLRRASNGMLSAGV